MHNEKIAAYKEKAERIYKNAEYAKQDGLDILLEYSEEQGMFHFNFITDKEKWVGQDNPSPYYMPIGYTNHLRYKAFREYAEKMGMVFYSPMRALDKIQKVSSLAEVEAVFANFEYSGGITDWYMVIDNIDVPVESMQITSANILKVTAGTNGIQGGDSGHGGRTVFCIEDDSSTAMRCVVETDEGSHEFGTYSHNAVLKRVKLIFGGDCELETFIKALEFAAETLRKQAVL